jgi:hypothetical protein
LSPLYDYAGAYNAINPVLYLPASPHISIGPGRCVEQASEAFAWRVHAKATPNPWNGTKNFKKSAKI